MKILYKAFGEEKTLKEWFEDKRCQVKCLTTLWQRFKCQSDLEEAIATPVGEKKYKAFGQKKTIKEWGCEYNLSENCLKNRLYKSNWNLEKVLIKPQRKDNVLYEAFGEKKTLREWIKDERCKVKSRGTLNSRIRFNNWSFERCISEKVKKINENDFLNKEYQKLIITKLVRKKCPDGFRLFADCICKICNSKFEARLDVIKNNPIMTCGCIKYNCGRKNRNWRGHEDISRSYFSDIKKSAIQRQIEFDVTIECLWDLFVKQNRKCALSGVNLEFSSKISICDGSASLDRIDSNKGYIVGNVQWVHKSLNRMKLDLPEDVFIEWCHQISDYKRGLLN